MCVPVNAVTTDLLQNLDALIVLNMAVAGTKIKPLLGKQTRLIFWTGHASDQPAISALQNRDERESYDAFAFVSEWQRQQYMEKFNISFHKTAILRNAISPSFSGLFSNDISIVSQKTKPPVLAYTSTPFRGLDILVEIFPKIRQAVSGTTLKVFSSMKVYQLSNADDEYNELYKKCQETEGIEYIGSVPQPELSRQLKLATSLVYPNHYPETSCIAVMEAMASGCYVITSNLGALAETTSDFASLISWENPENYQTSFINEIVRILKEYPNLETHLKQQVDYINNSCIWPVRSQEWIKWLNQICNFQQPAYDAFLQGNYAEAARLYEQEIEADSTIISNYWYLGLAYFLNEEELEAQTTWLLSLSNSNPEQISEFISILQSEIDRQKNLDNYTMAERLEQCIAEITN
jgi:glycosyltransferase involved in cell wall biosynthesis